MLASNSQDYTLQVDKAGLYEIRLVSDAFDPVLKLSGQGVDAENDDGGDSTNSRLTLSLKPGKYTLTARGLGDGVSGMFTLSANRIELPGNLVDRDGTALPKSGSVYTMLDNDGVRRFLLTLDRPTNVRLDAISGQVDTVLRVVGGDVELTDDDGGNDTNARRKKRCLPVITPSRCPASATARAWWKCVCRWTAPAPMGLLLRRQVPLPTRPLLRPMMPPRWKLPAVERVPHSVGVWTTAQQERPGNARPFPDADRRIQCAAAKPASPSGDSIERRGSPSAPCPAALNACWYALAVAVLNATSTMRIGCAWLRCQASVSVTAICAAGTADSHTHRS